MVDNRNKAMLIVKRKKTTFPKGLLSQEEKNTKKVIKLLRGYYQIYWI